MCSLLVATRRVWHETRSVEVFGGSGPGGCGLQQLFLERSPSSLASSSVSRLHGLRIVVLFSELLCIWMGVGQQHAWMGGVCSPPRSGNTVGCFFGASWFVHLGRAECPKDTHVYTRIPSVARLSSGVCFVVSLDGRGRRMRTYPSWIRALTAPPKSHDFVFLPSFSDFVMWSSCSNRALHSEV